MERVEVTYRGPNASYSIEHDGVWYEFGRGTRLDVPEEVAERVLDVQGHTFEVGDEVEVEAVTNEQGTETHPVITGPGIGSGEGSGSGDGAAHGVNAHLP